ncbi:MAG: S1 RNA-binding domain-containing protein [Chloroflexota bacterium]
MVANNLPSHQDDKSTTDDNISAGRGNAINLSLNTAQHDERDEGWWESVLSDEERFVPPHRPRKQNETTPSPSRSEQHTTPIVEISQADWNFAESVFKQDQIINLNVTNFNRGGLLVENSRLRGFVPYSHLVDMTAQTDLERDNFLAAFIGKTLRLKIIECVPEEGRVVFSERAARADAGKRTELFSNLQQGDIVDGDVTNITDFGAFIDLGGVEGLIHISELSWGRVLHPSQILKLGQKVRVQVIDILPDRCRIALSLKRLLNNPWDNIDNRYSVNDVVDATITSVVSFGVFARMGEGLEGLVHLSEIDLDGLSVRDLFEEGQSVKVRILHMDSQHQRLGLSMKLSGGKPHA